MTENERSQTVENYRKIVRLRTEALVKVWTSVDSDEMLKITSKLTADRFNPGLAGTLLEIMLYFTVTNFCKVSCNEDIYTLYMGAKYCC